MKDSEMNKAFSRIQQDWLGGYSYCCLKIRNMKIELPKD